MLYLYELILKLKTEIIRQLDATANLPIVIHVCIRNLNGGIITEHIYETQLHPKLITNQCAMEKFILLLLGLNLHKRDDGNDLDFKYTLNFLNKSIEILKGLFKTDANTVATHIKNMYNISAPGFFKNLVFNGGPNINPGIVSIENESSLNYHIDNFNTCFSHLGITVERRDIKSECAATLTKLSKIDDDSNKLSKYNWLIKWINKQMH